MLLKSRVRNRAKRQLERKFVHKILWLQILKNKAQKGCDDQITVHLRTVTIFKYLSHFVRRLHLANHRNIFYWVTGELSAPIFTPKYSKECLLYLLILIRVNMKFCSISNDMPPPTPSKMIWHKP